MSPNTWNRVGHAVSAQTTNGVDSQVQVMARFWVQFVTGFTQRSQGENAWSGEWITVILTKLLLDSSFHEYLVNSTPRADLAVSSKYLCKYSPELRWFPSKASRCVDGVGYPLIWGRGADTLWVHRPQIAWIPKCGWWQGSECSV